MAMQGTACPPSEFSLRAALQEGARQLAAAGCEQPRLDAEILLAHVLEVTRSYLYAHPERCLSEAESAAWQALLARRRGREPLAYIVGEKEFYDLCLWVDRRVLVPRPETELIVERVLALAAQVPLHTLWDAGTGSGALALALARHLPESHLVASDISAEALQVAILNRRRLGLEGRVQLVRCDLLACARGGIDVVVANLPYLRSQEYRQAMPEVSCHEPRLALDGGAQGLDLIARLLEQAAHLDPPPAYLLLEIGAGQGAEVVTLARTHFPERIVTLWRDYAGLDRVVEVADDLGGGLDPSPTPPRRRVDARSLRRRRGARAGAAPPLSRAGTDSVRHGAGEGRGVGFPRRRGARAGAASPLSRAGTDSVRHGAGEGPGVGFPRRRGARAGAASPLSRAGTDSVRHGAGEGPGVGFPTLILPPTPAGLALAADALRRGEVVAFPTDTVYGLGAATFETAVQALYEIKGRPEAKAIPLLLADRADLAKVVTELPPSAQRLMERFWPGPLTLVLQARPEIPAVVRANGATVAVRLPDHPVARALIEAVGTPLATTSANLSGAVEATTAAEVLAQLAGRVRWIVDGGQSPGGRPSSVVDLAVDPPLIRRVGAIPEETLRPLLSV